MCAPLSLIALLCMSVTLRVSVNIVGDIMWRVCAPFSPKIALPCMYVIVGFMSFFLSEKVAIPTTQNTSSMPTSYVLLVVVRARSF